MHDSSVNRRRWRLQQKAGVYSSVAEIRNDPLGDAADVREARLSAEGGFTCGSLVSSRRCTRLTAAFNNRVFHAFV